MKNIKLKGTGLHSVYLPGLVSTLLVSTSKKIQLHGSTFMSMKPSQTRSDERKCLKDGVKFPYSLSLQSESEWKSLSCVQLFATSWIVHEILQARILEWIAVPFPGDLTNPAIEPGFPALYVDSSPAELQGKHCPFKSCANSAIFPSFINLRHILPCPWVLYPSTPSFKNISNVILRFFFLPRIVIIF